MATGFDPYHRWLSIPPSDQPPNHYRLLGLQEFEASVEVIDNAASRQTTHVRPHLQSPLRPYAINLLRELEVARMCLSDVEAKLAYDAWLTQRLEYRSPSIPIGRAQESSAQSPYFPIPQQASQPENTRYPTSFEPPDQFTSPAVIVPSFVASNRKYRRKSKSNPIAFVFLWVTSGAIGLLAGYAVLCMIDPKYDFLHLMFGKDQEHAIENEGGKVPPIVTDTSDRRKLSRPVVNSESRRQGVPSLPAGSGNTDKFKPNRVAARLDMLHVDRKRSDGQVIEQKETANPVDAIRPIEFPFDLKKRIIRVVSKSQNLPSDKLFCNVHGSSELGSVPLIDLPLGEKRELLFKRQFNDVIVGADIAFIRRNQLVVVEICPKFRLPSGDEEAFYKIAGVRKSNVLARQVSAATNAKNSLPGMRSQLSRITTEYQAVHQTANTPTTAGGHLAQVAAQRRAAALFNQGAELEKQIRTAESLAANLSRLETDLAAVQQLGEWGAKIAESATLAVSIQNDGVALPAEVK